jgi:hypothetical protein
MINNFNISRINSSRSHFNADIGLSGVQSGPLPEAEQNEKKPDPDSKKGFIIPMIMIGVLFILVGVVYLLMRKGRGGKGDKGDVEPGPAKTTKKDSDNIPLSMSVFKFPPIGDALRTGISSREWKALLKDVVKMSYLGNEEKAKDAMNTQGVHLDELFESKPGVYISGAEVGRLSGSELARRVMFPDGFRMNDGTSKLFASLWAIKEAEGRASDFFISAAEAFSAAEAYGTNEFEFDNDRTAVEELIARCGFELENGSPLIHEHALMAHLIAYADEMKLSAKTPLSDALDAALDNALGKASWLISDAIQSMGISGDVLADEDKAFICSLMGTVQAKFFHQAAKDPSIANKGKADLLFRAKKQSSMSEVSLKTLNGQELTIPDSVISYARSVNKQVHDAFLSVKRFVPQRLVRSSS